MTEKLEWILNVAKLNVRYQEWHKMLEKMLAPFVRKDRLHVHVRFRTAKMGYNIISNKPIFALAFFNNRLY